MKSELSASYTACQRLARHSASNFYYSFLLLPKPKRAAMCALYAFLRRTDDLGDSGEPLQRRRAALGDWRDSFSHALEGTFNDPLLPALADTVARYSIPPEHLLAAIEGVEMDLDRARYRTFAELDDYCQRVASAVGLACIHIWGFRTSAALAPARACGVAFQLTNILRDLKEDAARDRVYLPQEDFERFGYSPDDLRRGVRDERFRRLVQFQVERAEQYYDRAAELDRWLEPDGRRIFAAMMATYRGLLAEIKRLGGDVLAKRVTLSGWRKVRIATRGLLWRPGAPAVDSSAGAARQ